MPKKIKFIDLFAGLGGIRIGFEEAAKDFGLNTECVFTSEIKESALKAYARNFHEDIPKRDITKVEASEIPEFNVLLGGFPCQAFSFAGSQKGFADTRGTLFFEIERILKFLLFWRHILPCNYHIQGIRLLNICKLNPSLHFV